MVAKFEELAESLGREHPSSEPKLTVFPSGAASMDVRVGLETYVFEYYPSLNGFGISRQSTAVFGWEGVENAFNSFEEAEAWLRGLLRKA